MAVAGAVLSRWVGGPVLLVLSGVVLSVVGLRVLRPGAPVPREVAARRREARWYVIGAAAVIGFAAGLLANGGGFLLVPLFLLALGLDMHAATGTSLLVAAVLTVPTLAAHALIGDIDWSIAVSFAVGLVPGAFVATRAAPHVPTARLRTAFGALLVGFAVWYVGRQVLALFS
jgi:uncharacterized membrane protein YfcA